MTESASPIAWRESAFDALTPAVLYALLRLRSEVFVLEQRCLFQDMDGHDAAAWHLCGWRGEALVAYARCLPAGVTFAEASIGRIVTAPSARGGGSGHALVQRAIDVLEARWGCRPIRIGAQAHLQAFYAAHGFVDVGRPYVEDGIDHLEMLRPSASS